MKFEYERVNSKNLLSYYDYYKCPQLKEDNQKLVEISRNNVLQIERILKIDSSYAYGNAGRTIRKLHAGEEKYNVETIKEICQEINKENHTRISRKEIEGIANTICGEAGKYKTYEKLMKELKNGSFNEEQEDEKYGGKLIELIYDKNKRNEGKKNYLSFATKFCHYMCLYCDNSNEDINRDGYPIYDNVVRKVIPLYIEYFKKKDEEFKIDKTYFKDIIDTEKNEINLRQNEGDSDFDIGKKYIKYCELLKIIKNKSKGRISYTGLDHLLWYCYKGRF